MEQPTIQHFPHPLATSAACDVMPPLAVKIAFAACIPCTSSGEVSFLTKITSSPFLAHSSAVSAENTTWPTPPPGPAGRPFANNSASFSDEGSTIECIISSS